MNPEELIALGNRVRDEGIARLSATLNYNYYVSSTRKGLAGNQPTRRFLRLTIKFTRTDGKTSTLISPTLKEFTLDEAKAIKPLLRIAEDVLNRNAAASMAVFNPPPPVPLPAPIQAPAPAAPAANQYAAFPKTIYSPDLGTLTLDFNVPKFGTGYHDRGINNCSQLFQAEKGTLDPYLKKLDPAAPIPG